MLPDPAALGLIPSGKIIDIAKVNVVPLWLEESGQWLENSDPTHLVLASGKPELQKRLIGLLARPIIKSSYFT